MILKTIRDVANAYRGIDIEEQKRQEREKREKEEKEYRENNFTPIWAKRYSIAITIMYIFYSVFIIVGAANGKNIMLIIITILLGLIAITGMIMMNIKNKQIQKYGCIIYSVFVVIELANTFVR